MDEQMTMVPHDEQTSNDIDIAAELKKDYESEEADNGKYMKLAAAADAKYPCRGYGSILRAIAKEEETHRKHIKLILEDMHMVAGDSK